MSSFIVENKTINRVLSFLYWHKNELIGHDYINDLRDLLRLPERDHTDEAYFIEMNALGLAMHKLNVKAVMTRYPDMTHKNISTRAPGTYENGHLIKYAFTEEHLSLIQAIKSLQCWLYQCCEGNIDRTKLYKFFKGVERTLMGCVIDALPEYDQAEWG
jgi:hypothetical protein